MKGGTTCDGFALASIDERLYLMERDALVANLQNKHEVKAEHIIVIEQGADCEQPDDGDGSVFYLYGDILPDSWGWGNNTTALRAFLDDQDGGDVTIRINSPGGILSAGVAMFNLLRDYPGKITAKVDGICASAATLPLIASDDRLMGLGTMVMIHNPRGAVYGDSAELQKAVKMLGQMNKAVAGMYVDRTDMNDRQVKKAMAEETFYTADDAISAGLATGKFEGDDGDATGDGESAPDDDDDEVAVLQNVLDAELYLREVTRKNLEY